MEVNRIRQRYNMTLDPAVKEAAMEALHDDETLSGIVQAFLEQFVARRNKNGKKKGRRKK